MEVGERIRKRREELNMTQDELALKVGYTSRSSIAKIEANANGVVQSKLNILAEALQTTPAYLLGWEDQEENSNTVTKKGFLIPVLGYVQAGIPVEAIEDIIDYEEISETLAKKGDYFGLKIRGASMEPKMSAGDVVIVRKQDVVEDGDIAVVLVNGNDATVKKIKLRPDGIMLIPLNPTYDPMFYSSEEVSSLPVRIIGKVVELRAKLE